MIKKILLIIICGIHLSAYSQITETKKTGWEVGSWIVSGGLFPTGQLKTYMPNGIPINMGVSVHYQKAYIQLGFGFAKGGDLKKELFSQKLWRDGDKVGYATGDLYLGYVILEKMYMRISPYVGFCPTGIFPYSDVDNAYYDEVENIISQTVPTYGVNFDLKNRERIGRSKSLYGKKAGIDAYYWIARLGLAYSNPKYDKDVPELTGGIFSLKIAFALQYQARKRI